MYMNYNYHTHTYRCNHATGTPEEVAESKKGYTPPFIKEELK